MENEPSEHTVNHKMSVDLWKWVAAALLSILMLMLGGFIASLTSQSALQEHAELGGHPIMDVRMQQVERTLREIKDDISDINDKLDR